MRHEAQTNQFAINPSARRYLVNPLLDVDHDLKNAPRMSQLLDISHQASIGQFVDTRAAPLAVVTLLWANMLDEDENDGEGQAAQQGGSAAVDRLIEFYRQNPLKPDKQNDIWSTAQSLLRFS